MAAGLAYTRGEVVFYVGSRGVQVTTMIFNRWGREAVFLIALGFTLSCSERSQQATECASLPASADAENADAIPEVEHSAFNSTFLRPEVAKLYGIEQDEKLGVVMVSVFRKDAPGVIMKACVSGVATNIMGQVTRLDFDEITEGEAKYHVGTFSFSQEEQLTFKLDVDIVATGTTRKLEWQQKFWPD